MHSECAVDATRPPRTWADHERLLMREVTKRLGRSLDPREVIEEMLHLLSELLGLNRGRVLLLDPDSAALSIRYAYGLTDAEVRRGRFKPDEGITGQVFTTGVKAIIQDIDAEPGFLCRTVERERLPQETVAFMALPIAVSDRTIGVLGCHRLRRRDRALADDVQLLETMAVLVGQVLELNRLVEERTATLESENRALKQALQRATTAARSAGVVGESKALQAALSQVERVAGTEATVLLLGESGTGKELLARTLHLLSGRRDAPFVKVNCAAIPENLFESELFGHEKGAYTGATAARAGRFELAHRGSLFLDEIGELPLATQAKLLRVLQERVIERVGSSRERAVDVRIVAATNRDLHALVSEGRFRLDLFYRLNVLPITLPPLRERPEDVRALARHFVSQLNQTYQRNVAFSAQAVDALSHFPWPGNVRQLANVIERIVLLSESSRIGLADVERVLTAEARVSIEPEAAPVTANAVPRAPRYASVIEDDRSSIVAAIARVGGNKTEAARSLGMTLRQLDYRVRQLGIAVTRKGR